MSIRSSYNEWATSYDSDRNLTRDLDQSVTRSILSGQPVTTILELGCGTGKNTSFYAEIGALVLALDFSEGMMERARAKINQPHVAFAAADFTDPLPCADNTIDLAACNLVLEHIADLTPLFTEVSRVLVTGGRFFVCELHPFRQYQGKKAVFQGVGGAAEIDAYVHHLSAFVEAARAADLRVERLNEWWHESDPPFPPRLVSFLFEK